MNVVKTSLKNSGHPGWVGAGDEGNSFKDIAIQSKTITARREQPPKITLRLTYVFISLPYATKNISKIAAGKSQEFA